MAIINQLLLHFYLNNQNFRCHCYHYLKTYGYYCLILDSPYDWNLLLNFLVKKLIVMFLLYFNHIQDPLLIIIIITI